MIGGVCALLAAIAVAVVISAATGGGGGGGGGARRGCVSVALAYSTGGAQIDRCGGGARALCAGVGHAGGITGTPATAVARACRRAGLPVG